MGVTGDVLARILRTAGRPLDLSNYSHGIEGSSKSKRNKKHRKILRPLRIGLDVSTWIARAAHGQGGMLLDERHLTNYGRAQLLSGSSTTPLMEALTTEENRQHYISLCTQKVLRQILNLITFSKADVLIVLDGASPPIKKEESKRRRDKKNKAELERDADATRQLQQDDNKALNRRLRAARTAGAGMSHGYIVAELLQLLRENQIEFIVSPYEADGQLAYLAQQGVVDLVMTEDSDLLCHEIQTIVFKYDLEGRGVLVQRHDLGAAELQPKSLSLIDFSTTMIAIMFVCIGCDYVDSLLGIGCVKARDIVRNVFQTKDPEKPAIRRIFDSLYGSTRKQLSSVERTVYEERFMAALFGYQHPVVFCPMRSKCVVANNPPHGSDPVLLEYEPYAALCANKEKQHSLLGAFPERRLQLAIAEGWINPRENQPYPHVALPEHIQALMMLPDQQGDPRSSREGGHTASVSQDASRLAITPTIRFEKERASVEKEKDDGSDQMETQEVLAEATWVTEQHQAAPGDVSLQCLQEGERIETQERYQESQEEEMQQSNEQKAAEDTQEARRPSSQEELTPLETQLFDTNSQCTPFQNTPQAFHSQKSAGTCDTPGSNLAQFQQPSQGSEVGQQQHQQQRSSQNSNGEIIEVIGMDADDEDDDDDVTVSYPSPKRNESADQPFLDHTTQDLSPVPAPSTQSSRTTLGGNSSSKLTSQSTTASARSDVLSPPLLP